MDDRCPPTFYRGAMFGEETLLVGLRDRLMLLSPWDGVAVSAFLLAWWGIGWLIDRETATRPSVAVLMARYRREWMEVFVQRTARMFDASILYNLRQGTTFFASGAMLGIGGLLALIGNSERLVGVARDLSLAAAPAAVWEMKLLLCLLVLTNAFLKFVWSQRLFGYCAILMAAVPEDPADPRARMRARQAAEVNITAARSFNRGLRSVYFALAALAWLIGPIGLLVATGITLVVLWRREYASRSRSIILGNIAAVPGLAGPDAGSGSE